MVESDLSVAFLCGTMTIALPHNHGRTFKVRALPFGWVLLRPLKARGHD
jgi:hypothetical protein